MSNNNRHTSLLPPPSKWFLYWGITVLFVGFLVFLGLSWLIRYPEILTAPALVTSAKPPLELVTPGEGKLEVVHISDKDTVEKGQLLFVLENTAILAHIRQLENWVSTTKKTIERSAWNELRVLNGMQLGTVQEAYALAYKNIQDFKQFLANNVTASQIRLLEEQVEQIRALNEAMEEQASVLKRIADIALKDFGRHQDSSLYSEFEKETAEIGYLQYKRQYEELKSKMIHNTIRIREIEFQIFELQENLNRQLGGYRSALRQSFLTLEGSLEAWRKGNYLIAPMDGVIEFAKPWRNNSYVEHNELLGYIIPFSVDPDIFARVTLDVKGAGKVEPGMKVRVRLDNFPYREFGVLKGEVSETSTLADESGTYKVIVLLDAPLLTNYGIEIDYRPEMSGVARIVTHDKRFIERLFEELLSVMKDN